MRLSLVESSTNTASYLSVDDFGGWISGVFCGEAFALIG
jgi:hypothetical protein